MPPANFFYLVLVLVLIWVSGYAAGDGAWFSSSQFFLAACFAGILFTRSVEKFIESHRG